jgi:hypothetical protein
MDGYRRGAGDLGGGFQSGVVGLGSGFRDVSGALSGLYDASFGKLIRTEFEAGEDRRKNEAAERMKNFARAYGQVPKNEQLIGDRYGLSNYYPVFDR